MTKANKSTANLTQLTDAELDAVVGGYTEVEWTYAARETDQKNGYTATDDLWLKAEQKGGLTTKPGPVSGTGLGSGK